MAGRHILDGNMRAADAHYNRGASAEVGDPCPACEEGWLIEQEDDDGAPIEDEPLVCNDCGKEVQ